MNAPLLLKPNYKTALWGGSRIATCFARADTPAVCAESWEISGHPAGPSVVAEGPFAGRTLNALVREFGPALVGTRAPDPSRFPLLFKILDATRDLSVQVHPNAVLAPQLGGEAKNEAWFILDATPDARLYAGLAEGTREADLRAAEAAGRDLEARLVQHVAQPGDVYYIPAGTVHALGAGCLVYEVQQSADTTYRLYDWGRVGADGRPRPLHVANALAAIDYTLPPVVRRRDELVTPHFRLRVVEISAGETSEIALDGTTFVALFAIEGDVAVTTSGGAVHLKQGGSGLVPAAAGWCRLEARARARLVVTTL